jgi:succinate dehydrogenase/fumarate reductase flavoprotein subunit
MASKWPYPLEYAQRQDLTADVLIAGGGVAGCMAAIAAAGEGRKVILVEKGDVRGSGAGGSGCDHWEAAATNPCSSVTPERLTQAMLDENAGFNNGISHYIECREGYDRLLDLERMGAKIRDTDNEFQGADFRDEDTKLLFAYDYESRHTLRVWGTTFRPAMMREMKRLGVMVVDRVMVTSLLTADGKQGGRCAGAIGVHTRTGKLFVFRSLSTVLCTSRPARIWLFSAELPGLCEFRPTQCIGDGHAMGWNAGAEFTMMEKSVGAQFSAAGRSYPPYAAGNNHNTWYGASLIDAAGREIPYADRDGRILRQVAERFRPAPGQDFFLMGGSIDEPSHAVAGPETLPMAEMIRQGYRLPFYADLTGLPDPERRVIWGMMVGEEGKTRVPVLQNHTARGFDPARDVLQCYGTGWMSASFLPQERQLFGLPGGFHHDWRLMTNIEGLYVAGDALFASNCHGHAAATGHYAGRHAAKSATGSLPPVSEPWIAGERERLYKPLTNRTAESISWKELNMAIAKTMQTHCGAIKHDDLLRLGLARLEEYGRDAVPRTCALNPHEWTRLLEVFSILENAKMVLHACLARKKGEPALCFERAEMPGIEADADEPRSFIVMSRKGNEVLTRHLPLGWFGNLRENYERVNAPD